MPYANRRRLGWIVRWQHEGMKMAKNIRLKIPGESFWATQYDDIPTNQAEINNHLLSEQYSYGDRVEFDDDRNVVRLVKSRAQVAAESAAT